MTKRLSPKSNILIGTFAVWVKGKRTPINGMIEPLLSFFGPRVARIDLIDGPHPGSERICSIIEIHQKGRLKKTLLAKSSFLLWPLLKLTNVSRTQPFFKIRDLLAVLEWGIFSRQKYQLFVGLEAIYTLAGIILKKLGIAETVVYYVSDYSPNRYPQKWFNDLYLWLDRFCAMHTDFIWDVSKAMHPARIKAGLDPKKSAPEIHVPNALFAEQLNYLPLKKLGPSTLVYAGTFGKENGVDLAIKALPLIKKEIPGIELHICGGNGSDEKRLKKLTKDLKLQQIVTFHGFITDLTKLTRIIQKFQVGIAPYLAIPGSHRWYADATKLRLYLAAGLPVITTQVPPLGKEVAKAGAGLVTEDNEKEFAKAIIKLFGNKTLYQKTRQAAIKYIKNNTWENTYRQALEKIGMI